jgi:excisionase family DNA binding protein
MGQPVTFENLPQAVSNLSQKIENLEKLLVQQKGTNQNPYFEKFLTVKQAASFLNLSVATIYSKVSRGELPFMKRSKRLYFSSEELSEYIKEGRRKTNEELEASPEDYLLKTKKGAL